MAKPWLAGIWMSTLVVAAIAPACKGTESGEAGAGGGGAPTTTNSSGRAGMAGSASSGSAPAGFVLTPGLQIGDIAECDGLLEVSCSGSCVTRSAGVNGCQAVATSRIFSDMARDSQGIYFSLQGSGNSSIVRLDGASGALVEVAAPPGDNVHVHLSLADDVIYLQNRDVLGSVPRIGGTITEWLQDLPSSDLFVVAGQRLFLDVWVTRDVYELHEVDITQGATTVHARDVSSMVRDGSDVYFAESGALYRAANADLGAAQAVGPGPVDALLGVSGDWIYGIGGQDAERAVRRFPKAGGAGVVVRTLGAEDAAGLGDDAVVFTHHDGLRQYISTVDLDGNHPTIHGYVAPSGAAFLTADASYVYAVFGFNMVRFERWARFWPRTDELCRGWIGAAKRRSSAVAGGDLIRSGEDFLGHGRLRLSAVRARRPRASTKPEEGCA